LVSSGAGAGAGAGAGGTAARCMAACMHATPTLTHMELLAWTQLTQAQGTPA